MTMAENVIPLYDPEPGDYQRGRATGGTRTPRNWHARQANARKELAALRDLAKTANCPPAPHGCGKPIGAECVDRKTGKPLKHFPGHTARINLARKAMRSDDA
ncbi:hypothetical protein H7J86_26170 [Mycobacterium hackensackense]|uniref:hypothetical protein n=1 Tax=Mycobacterium hackensackense TaxID=228909 RepID=UPI002265F80E|nr:hypothetical protein [Mycobacterium hackensackense]MCV7255655.1 hypothetical protein [Mycobacterium hackensackense]